MSKLVRIARARSGEWRLTLEEDAFPRPTRRTLYIDEENYSAAGSPAVGEILDEETVSLLAEAEGRAKAEERAMRILGYAPCSANALMKKLRAKGYDRESAECAVLRMIQKGYLDEAEQAYRLAVLAVGQKCWGRRRVLAYLASKGYPSALAREAIARAEEEGEIDFSEARARLLERHLSEDAAPEEKRALLYKYGY